MVEPLQLLHQLSWHAEKLFRKRGRFHSVLWLTLDAAEKCQLHEPLCGDAPKEVSDEQLLAALAAELGEDFRGNNIGAFAIAYAAARVTVSRPVEQILLLQPVSVRVSVIVLGAHDDDTHLRAHRESFGCRAWPQHSAL
jgi:hypothetical protein